VERTQQLRERRAAILAGAALTEEEAAAPAVVSDETPVPTELEDDLKLYWQKAIMQGVLLHDVEALQSENVPNELDLRILAHLADIQLAIKTHTDDALDERDTVHLVLVFRPNEFLEPGFETLECAFDRVKGQLKSTSGLEIRWRDGKAPTIEGSLSFFDVFAKVGDFAQQAEEKAAVTKELLALIEEVLLHNSISQVRGSPEPVATSAHGALGRMTYEPQPALSAAVASFPSRVDSSRALALGMAPSLDATAMVRAYVEDFPSALAPGVNVPPAALAPSTPAEAAARRASRSASLSSRAVAQG